MKITGLILFAAALALLVTLGDQGFMQWRRLAAREASLRTEIRTLTEGNRERIREISILNDPASLERHVREELGYVREDEVLYEFPANPQKPNSP